MVVRKLSIENLRAGIGAIFTPPAVMVVIALFAVLSTPTISTDNGRDSVLNYGRAIAMAPVPDSVSEPELPTGTLTPRIGAGETVMRPSVAPREGTHELVGPLQIARASVLGPSVPAFLARNRSGEPRKTYGFSYLLGTDDFVGPPEPASRIADTMVAPITRAQPHQELAELVGPVLPAPETLAAGEFVGPVKPEYLELADCGIEGPPAPAWLAAARDPEVIEALVGFHAPHGLPFDPLAVGPFLPEGGQSENQLGNPFADFLASQQDELHTVRYSHELKHKLRPGETISAVLANLGLDSAESDLWIRAAGSQYNLDRVFAGQEVALLLNMPERELKRMSIEVASENVLVAEREGEQVAARLEPIVYDRNLRVVGAEVDHSLYMAAQSQGVPDKIVSDVAEILGWEIDFGRELDHGARVRVVYEELTRVDTAETVAGRVLAVAVDNRGERLEGFYYKMPDGSHAGYYNREGEGLGRAFLRYPVSYSRISSQFSTKRFHPVLKRNVPHYGVDFAAPSGTPVKAVADGSVVMAGWHGGNGRFVKIRHDTEYESGYAHLSRIAPAVKNGTRVKQGQVIGYVGSTGLATGPHLHFALYRNATYVDPLKAELPRPHSLSGNALVAFRMTVDMMDRSYANAGHGEDPEQEIVTAALD